MRKCTDAQMHKCINAQMHKCTNAQMHSCTVAQMHKCTDAQAHKCMNAQMHNCINAQMHKCINAQMHKCINAQIHKCTNAQMHMWTHARLRTLQLPHVQLSRARTDQLAKADGQTCSPLSHEDSLIVPPPYVSFHPESALSSSAVHASPPVCQSTGDALARSHKIACMVGRSSVRSALSQSCSDALLHIIMQSLCELV
eukprot:2020972-Pleurochrysis_carterae.AAC.2